MPVPVHGYAGFAACNGLFGHAELRQGEIGGGGKTRDLRDRQQQRRDQSQIAHALQQAAKCRNRAAHHAAHNRDEDRHHRERKQRLFAQKSEEIGKVHRFSHRPGRIAGT